MPYTTAKAFYTEWAICQVRELADGERSFRFARGPLHGLAVAHIAFHLMDHLRELELEGVVGVCTPFVTGAEPASTVVPDVAYARSPTRDESGHLAGAPDLAVLVAYADLKVGEIEKMVGRLHAGGTTLAWLVYPEARRVDVFPRAGDASIVDAEERLSGEPVLPDLYLPVKTLLTFPA